MPSVLPETGFRSTLSVCIYFPGCSVRRQREQRASPNQLSACIHYRCCSYNNGAWTGRNKHTYNCKDTFTHRHIS